MFLSFFLALLFEKSAYMFRIRRRWMWTSLHPVYTIPPQRATRIFSLPNWFNCFRLRYLRQHRARASSNLRNFLNRIEENIQISNISTHSYRIFACIPQENQWNPSILIVMNFCLPSYLSAKYELFSVFALSYSLTNSITSKTKHDKSSSNRK